MRRGSLGFDPIESVVSARWASRNYITGYQDTGYQDTGYQPRGFVSPSDNHP
jgi:hypothetical protein